MTTKIRIGLIGFGWMGQAHSRSYRNIPVYFPDCEIVPELIAMADTVSERRDLAVENFGYANATADWREVVGRTDIDVIDITAPNALHQQIAEAAAAAGKHIFCEKPVGIEPAATAAIEAAARSVRESSRASDTTTAGRRWSSTPSSSSTNGASAI